VRTYVVEPQQIFVPSLLHLLQESGLSIVRVRDVLDPLDVLRTRPQMLFCDCDAMDDQIVQGLQFLSDSMPELDVCIYSRTEPLSPRVRMRAPTRLLHLEKSASHEALVSALGRFVVNA
jgi:DNA-binding NtrC family response regulator